MDQEHARRLVSLEARMDRMEAWMQEVLRYLGTNMEGTVGINPPEVQPQELLEIVAIRQALLSGNKILAIKLYRSLYGVGLKEAKDAIDAM